MRAGPGQGTYSVASPRAPGFNLAKTRVQYICQHCGAVHARWLGQCPDCGEWNTILEGVAPAPRKGGGYAASAGQGGVELLSDVSLTDVPRVTSGSPEMDRVLGGGIVPGAVILIGGDPALANPPCCCRCSPRCRRSGPRCT